MNTKQRMASIGPSKKLRRLWRAWFQRVVDDGQGEAAARAAADSAVMAEMRAESERAKTRAEMDPFRRFPMEGR